MGGLTAPIELTRPNDLIYSFQKVQDNFFKYIDSNLKLLNNFRLFNLDQ